MKSKREYRIDDIHFFQNEKYEGETYYGSCPVCDSLIAISNYDYGEPTEKQVSSYMLLALELIEQLKEVKNK